MNIIIGVFDRAHDAHQAMELLRADPLRLKDVSIIARARDLHTHTVEDRGTTDGAIWGGIVGLVDLMLPGVGPFISGVALIDFSGITSDEAIVYERAIRAGKTLVAIKANDEDVPEVLLSLARASADQATGDRDGAAAAPAWVMIYDDHGQRLEHALPAGAARGAGASWTSGEVIGEGQGAGPRKDTGTYDARQWVGEGQGETPRQTGGAQPWTSGEVIGEGQGAGPRKDTGTYDAGQWVGEGQGNHPASEPSVKRSDK